MKTKLILSSLLALFLLAGCQTKTTNIDTDNDTAGAVMALDYRDFNKAASEMLQDLFRKQLLVKPDGTRHVMAMGQIVNDTMQRIDTDQLMVKIQEELIGSGQVLMTAATGAPGSIDANVFDTRELRNDDEFKQSTIAGKGTLVAPDLSISGKIFQKTVRVDKKTTQVEYYFQLRITGLNDGLTFWVKEVMIGKRGSPKNAVW